MLRAAPSLRACLWQPMENPVKKPWKSFAKALQSWAKVMEKLWKGAKSDCGRGMRELRVLLLPIS